MPAHLAVRIHSLIHRVRVIVEAEIIAHHRLPLLQGPGLSFLQGDIS